MKIFDYKSCICISCINTFFGQYLDKATWSNTVAFVPPVTNGKVVKVYDGDTITVASRLAIRNSPIYRFPVRLLGIDSPEIKGSTENEKKLAKQSRDALHELLFDKHVILKNVTTEKYGRLLANVYINDIHVNKWMLDNKYAIEYDGGTKSRPVNWN